VGEGNGAEKWREREVGVRKQERGDTSAATGGGEGAAAKRGDGARRGRWSRALTCGRGSTVL